jgi:hypothetical protein
VQANNRDGEMSSLSIGRAWDEGKAALRANQKWIVPVALGLVLLPAVIVSMVEPQMPPGQQPPAGTWMLVAAAMALVMIVGQLAIVLMVNGWRGSVGEAISKALRRTPTFVIAFLCVMVPVILIISFLLAIIGIGTSAGGQVDWTTFSGTGWLLLLLCLVLLLYLSIRMLPLIAVVASESGGPIASLKRAWSLTSGHFWRLLGFLLMLMIGFLIFALAVGALIGTLVTLTLGPSEPWSLSLLLIALAGGLVQAAFVMVYIAMIARIYAQLSSGQASVPDVKRED